MSIFDQAPALSVAPFYFKEIGDQVEGTYIGKREKDADGNYERDNFNNEIITYELQVPDGIKNVSFTLSKKINEDMKHVKFGQIIGFKYVSKDKFMKNGKETEFKNIKVFADPKIVDKEWVAMHADGTSDSGAGAVAHGQSQADKDFDSFGAEPTNDEPFVSESSSPEAKLKAISELAKTKLGVIDPSAVKDAVMTATSLAFLPVNYMKIIEILTSK